MARPPLTATNRLRAHCTGAVAGLDAGSVTVTLT